MKKHLLLLFFLFMLSNASFAAYLTNVPVEIKQPNGEIIQLFVSGDEYYRRIHDVDGYTIIRDPKSGYLVYAIVNNNNLVSSGYHVGKADPKKIGLTPKADISADKKIIIRQNFLKYTTERLNLKDKSLSLRASTITGSVCNLVIYIRFSDQLEFLPSANAMNDRLNKNESGASLYSYFQEASLGEVNVSSYLINTQGNTIISYIDPYPRSYYQEYHPVTNPSGYTPETEDNSAERARREHGLLKRAIEAVKNQIPSIKLDNLEAGYVDNISFIIRGESDGWSGLLWPHQWALYSEDVRINGARVWDYNFYLDSPGTSVLVHEFYHTLGAPDLYRYNDLVNPITPVGSWDVMASNTTPPQSSTAWVKHKYGGWISNIPEITESNTYTINNIWSASNNCYKIASPNSSDEFFMIEYRDKGVIWDSNLYGNGLIIYRVNQKSNGNSNATASNPNDEIYVFRPGGINMTTNGNLNNAYFSSNSGRTTFSDITDPPAFLSNNTAGLSGIVISDISSAGGATMSFKVTFPIMGKPVAEPATLITRTGFTANWIPSNGATSYLLSVYYMNGNTKIYASGYQDKNVGNVISYKVENLDRNISTEWYYTIKAVSGGVPSEESNEINLKLEKYDPVICDFVSNEQEKKGYTCASFQNNGGFLNGPNVNGYTDYAEYYNSEGIVKITHIKMRIYDLSNNSKDPNFTKITLKIWKKGNDGKPEEINGNAYYEQDVSFEEFTAHTYKTIELNSPVYISGPFFLGYKVYYSPVIMDHFSVGHTYPSDNPANNTLYYKNRYSIWNTFGNTWDDYNISMYIFPEICPFAPEASFTTDLMETTVNTPITFTNTSLVAPGTTWLWDFGNGKTSADENPTYAYSAAGTYTVSLHAENAIGISTYSKQIVIQGAPNVTWNPLALSTNWDDANNWDTKVVPTATSNVIIPESNSYPILTSPTTVAEIHFAPGAQIGNQSKLTGNAFVQYNLIREKWNMFSMPLQEAYPGDFVFGGYPLTWIRLFSTESDGGSVTKGGWATARGSRTAFEPGDGFVIWLNEDGGVNDKAGMGLKILNNILELPNYKKFETGDFKNVNHAQDYNSGTKESTFYNFALNGNNYERKTDENYPVDRTDNAYKLLKNTGVFTKELDFGQNNQADGIVTLVGNPYMAALDFSALHLENAAVIKSSYHIWDGGDSEDGGCYITYTPDGPAGKEIISDTKGQLIAPLQSFLVEKANDAAGKFDLKFAESMTTVNKAAVLRSTKSVVNKLDIVAQNPVAGVRTFIAKREGGQTELGNSDARKIINSISSVPEIYTLKPYKGKPAAVSANIVDTDDLLIPVGISTSYAGDIKLTFSGMDNYNANLFLIDAETNKEINLSGLASYDYVLNYTPKKVNGVTSACEDRLFIRISKSVTGLKETLTENVNVYESNGLIKIISGASNPIKDVTIYNPQGALVYKESSLNTISHTVSRNWPVGVYFVKVVSENNVDNVKLILK